MQVFGNWVHFEIKTFSQPLLKLDLPAQRSACQSSKQTSQSPQKQTTKQHTTTHKHVHFVMGDVLRAHDEHLVEVRLAQPAPRRRRAERATRKPQTAIHSPPPTPRGVSPLRSGRCSTSRKAREGSSDDASPRLDPLASFRRWLFGQPSPHSQITYEVAAKKQIRRSQGAAWPLMSI